MLAVKVKGFDLKEGQEFKFFFIVDPDSGDFRQLASERVNANDEDPDINELRFKTGIKDIYDIIDMKSWGNYWNHRYQLIELNANLANDPAVQKDIADYEKDQKQFRIWQAANKWDSINIPAERYNMTNEDKKFIQNFIKEHPDYVKNMLDTQKEHKELLDSAAKAGHGKTYSFVIKD